MSVCVCVCVCVCVIGESLGMGWGRRGSRCALAEEDVETANDLEEQVKEGWSSSVVIFLRGSGFQLTVHSAWPGRKSHCQDKNVHKF